MTAFVTAVYHDGVLELLEPLPLEENQKVSLIVTPLAGKKLPPSDFAELRGIWRGMGDELVAGLEEARRETKAKLERLGHE
jgi:predicted DNA-binding antitoxin AbrB/MazE fold protein